MLATIIRQRPKNLYAVYVESRCVEVLRARRRWRKWEMEPAERFQVPEGESVFDYLQHMNLRPKGRKGTTLLLILPSTFYSVHREHYPPSLQDQLDEAINFDWQENIFHETDRTLYFSGPAVSMGHHVSVPIFSMQKEIYEKFQQVLGGSQFSTFTVMPSALAFNSFLPSLAMEDSDEPLEIVARVLDDSHLEIHRFYQGSFLDSVVIGKSFHNMRLFLENLRCMGNGNGECRLDPHIHLLYTTGESASSETYGRQWLDDGFPIQLHRLNDCFVTHWVSHLLEQDNIHTFDTELLLKPWKIPRIAWPLLGIILLFAAYAFYQVHLTDQLAQTSKRLKVQVNQLEIQWKPIEEFQTRISKFQEDRKTLSEFNREGYPLLELLSFLTQLTPDDTWLNYLSLRKGQLIIRGESKSAIKYLSELSKTEGLSDVKFASPVTRNPASDMERFNVQLQLDIEKLQKSFDALPTDKLDESSSHDLFKGADPGQAAQNPAVEEQPQAEVTVEDGAETEPEAIDDGQSAHQEEAQ